MSRGLSYDRVREASRGIRYIRLNRNRLMLDIERGDETQTIDVTDVYYFVKDMYKTDWREQVNDMQGSKPKSHNRGNSKAKSEPLKASKGRKKGLEL